MRLTVAAALAVQSISCSAGPKAHIDGPSVQNSELETIKITLSCEPVGCRKDPFLIDDAWHPFDYELEMPSPGSPEKFIRTQIPLEASAGFASVEDRQFYRGHDFWRVVATEGDKAGYRSSISSKATYSSIPFTVFGPFRTTPGIVREVLGAYMPTRTFRRIGVPGDVAAFRTSKQEFRKLIVRCGCDLELSQDWYWQEDRWCLARSVPEPVQKEALSGRSCEDSEPSHLDRDYVPLDALLCPPQGFPFDELNPPLCSVEQWLSTTAGASLPRSLSAPKLVGRRNRQWGGTDVPTGFEQPSRLPSQNSK